MRWGWLMISAGALFAQPANQEFFAGKYVNVAGYGYHAEVPAGLKGSRMSAPAPDHGFRIDLPGGGENYIWVDGAYNVLFYRTARDASAANDKWVAQEGKVEGKPVLRDTSLAGLPAEEATFRLVDNKSRLAMVVQTVTALRSGKEAGIVYTIGLHTEASRFAEQQPLWQYVVASFRLDPAP